MKYIADLHTHSKYSRATSKESCLEGYFQWSRIKGIQVVGTGDFTHPGWFGEIREKLVEDGSGFLQLKKPPRDSGMDGASPQPNEVRYVLSAEISCIYKRNGQTRKVHHLLLAPDIAAAGRIGAKLGSIGNITSDGRPILGLDSHDLLAIVLSADPRACLIPAHIWTPWFSLFGSRSGFDRIEECFADLTQHIFALETGLSSDPEMNWRWSALDRYSLVSNSDAHSPQKLGREANRFDTDLTYDAMIGALRTGQGNLGTIEFFPEEGKYHMDGHRKCEVCLEPEESAARKDLCPVCGKSLTIGVLHRVVELADRAKGKKPKGAPNFCYLIPLSEVLGEIVGAGPGSKKVAAAYAKMIATFGNEFALLLSTPIAEIRSKAGEVLAEAVDRMRKGRVHPQSGYDGEFGVIRVFAPGELPRTKTSLAFFGF